MQMYKELGGPEMVSRYAKPVWTGTAVFRAMISYGGMKERFGERGHKALKAPQMYCGKGLVSFFSLFDLLGLWSVDATCRGYCVIR